MSYTNVTEQFLKSANKRKKKSKEVAEVDIETPFVKFAKRSGCIAYKLIILGLRSFPDRTIFCPGGRVFFIEFKKKGKPLTEAQNKIKIRLNKLGFKYYVCDEIGQAEQILKKFLEAA